jgi:hypothetical protein
VAAGPLNHLVLAARSVADDLGCVALADISRLLDTTTDYRVIGGFMVTALAYRWNLGASLYRETLDADLGVPPVVARDLDIVGRLKAAGYQQVARDRFEKPVRDIPAGLTHTTRVRIHRRDRRASACLYKPATAERQGSSRARDNRSPRPSERSCPARGRADARPATSQ